MSIRWKDKLILAKTEAVYGTDPTPTGAANAILLTDVTLTPMEGEDLPRDLIHPSMGNQGMLLGSVRVTLAGSTELAGSGAAGTAPAWGPLARACALSETINVGVSVVYEPVTDAHESITIWFWQGATLHRITGARGNAVVTVGAQGIPRIAWTFTGLYNAPGEVAQEVPTFTAWKKPLVATKANTPTFTIDAAARVLRNFTLDLGNDAQPRLLVGKEEVLIVDKAEQLSATIEAVPLTTFDLYARALARTPSAINLVHGIAAGNIVTIAAPVCELARPTGLENQQGVVEWPLQFRPLLTDGDDQFTITLT